MSQEIQHKAANALSVASKQARTKDLSVIPAQTGINALSVIPAKAGIHEFGMPAQAALHRGLAR